MQVRSKLLILVTSEIEIKAQQCKNTVGSFLSNYKEAKREQFVTITNKLLLFLVIIIFIGSTPEKFTYLSLTLRSTMQEANIAMRIA